MEGLARANLIRSGYVAMGMGLLLAVASTSGARARAEGSIRCTNLSYGGPAVTTTYPMSPRQAAMVVAAATTLKDPIVDARRGFAALATPEILRRTVDQAFRTYVDRSSNGIWTPAQRTLYYQQYRSSGTVLDLVSQFYASAHVSDFEVRCDVRVPSGSGTIAFSVDTESLSAFGLPMTFSNEGKRLEHIADPRV